MEVNEAAEARWGPCAAPKSCTHGRCREQRTGGGERCPTDNERYETWLEVELKVSSFFLKRAPCCAAPHSALPPPGPPPRGTCLAIYRTRSRVTVTVTVKTKKRNESVRLRARARGREERVYYYMMMIGIDRECATSKNKEAIGGGAIIRVLRLFLYFCFSNSKTKKA